MSHTYKDYILDAYFKQNKSTLVIAKELGVSTKLVRNTILKSGNKLRTKKESAETSYKNGRSPPMSGKTHSDSTKKKIAKSVHENWTQLSEKDYEKRIEKFRENWYNLDVSVRENIIYKSRLAIAKSSKEGSKLELFVSESLIKHNFSPVIHYDKFPYEKLEVDIFLPANKIAIEIDGPSHTLPIYGDDRLESTIKSDEKKNNLLLGMGYVVIRIRYVDELSNYKQSLLIEELIILLNKINNEFPPDGYRYIELEIT